MSAFLFKIILYCLLRAIWFVEKGNNPCFFVKYTPPVLMTQNHSHVSRYVVSADLHRPVSQGEKVRDWKIDCLLFNVMFSRISATFRHREKVVYQQ